MQMVRLHVRIAVNVISALALILAATVCTALCANGMASSAPSAAIASLTAAPGVGSISVGNTFACGIRATGQATCWGLTSTGDTKAPSGTFARVERRHNIRLRDQDHRDGDLLGEDSFRGHQGPLGHLQSDKSRKHVRLRD